MRVRVRVSVRVSSWSYLGREGEAPKEITLEEKGDREDSTGSCAVRGEGRGVIAANELSAVSLLINIPRAAFSFLSPRSRTSSRALLPFAVHEHGKNVSSSNSSSPTKIFHYYILSTHSDPSTSFSLLYTAATTRRTAYDTLTWQGPVLTFTASAFLYTIVLSYSTARAARIVACCLNIATSALGYALFLRANQAQNVDNEYIEELERCMGFPAELKIRDKGLHGSDWAKRRNNPLPLLWWNVPPFSSIKVWSSGFLAALILNLVLLVISCARPEMLV